MKNIANVLLILFVIGFLGYKYVYQAPKYSDGEILPNFETTLLNEEAFELKQLRGKYVLVDFWGSWCPPCREDNPNIVKLYDEFNGKSFTDAEGFEVVSIAIETKKDRCVSAIEQDGLRWEYHIVLLDRFKSEIAKAFGVREIPTKYLLSPSGKIISVNSSYENLQKMLNDKLK